MNNKAPQIIFRQRLLKARTLRKLSLAALAKRTGLSPSAICHFENGRRLPNLANLCRLAEGLQVTTDYLSGRSDMLNPGITTNRLIEITSKMSLKNLQLILKIAELLNKS